ncbi:glycosyltransferase family 4 protein [Paractinoplanes durhamensis]|uniref:glycosyltransferase family 4 protein n=1 Tax=Paractinoplanes durhamensis TaxID=113563 RepID=UPI00362C4AD4
MAGEIAEAAVVVVPSLWPENFPTVALEALQAGRALVASQVGGLPELVGNDNGVLVPPGDVAALADALGGLIGQAERLAQLGAGSAARAGRYDIGLFWTRWNITTRRYPHDRLHRAAPSRTDRRPRRRGPEGHA